MLRRSALAALYTLRGIYKTAYGRAQATGINDAGDAGTFRLISPSTAAEAAGWKAGDHLRLVHGEEVHRTTTRTRCSHTDKDRP